MCGGEGCLIDGKKPVDPVEEAKKKEDEKLDKVIGLLASIEDVGLLDAVEAKLRAMDVDAALELVESQKGGDCATAAPPPTAGLEKTDKDAPPTVDTALEISDMCSPADAQKLEEALQSMDGVTKVITDLEKKTTKVVSSPGFPTAKQMIDVVVAAGFSATEKRLAGGMFKFDPAEVDVEGGDATADDFMDAFGF